MLIPLFQEGQEKLKALQKVVMEAKLKLKQERRSLIESWLTVSVMILRHSCRLYISIEQFVKDLLIILPLIIIV